MTKEEVPPFGSLGGPNHAHHFNKWETLGLRIQFGLAIETSTLKQAFQFKPSFWSGSDRLSIFWSKEDSQRRSSSIWIFRMDQIMRTTLTSGKP